LLFSLLALPLIALAVEQVQVLGLFTGKAIILIDGKRYTLAVGESSPQGVKLLAADSDKALIEVAGERREVQLGSQISSAYPEAKTKVVDIYPDQVGMYRVQGAINDKPVHFLVDTGASAIAMNSGQAQRLGIDYRRNGVPGLAETASAKVRIYQVKLDKVTVGKIRVYNVLAMVLEGEQPSQVLLGQSFLNQLQMKREGALLRLEQHH
jgi:aspartyl protease family protein